MINFDDFDGAARAVLKTLRDRLKLDFWMVTRTEGNDWIVLETEGSHYPIEEGSVFQWTDSFCSRMVAGQGPCIAPRSGDVPAYREAPIGRQQQIGAYIGVPLYRADGALFGTLCAIDPQEKPPEIVAELPLVETMSRLLSTILDAELKADQLTRRAQRAESDATTDGLTGLYNRRGWDRLLDAEEARCRRYGHSATVVMLDLDGLKQVNDTLGHPKGDEFICRAATALRSAVRGDDVVARFGGDEFAVLAVECNGESAQALERRIALALDEANVAASYGIAVRDPRLGLTESVAAADAALYVSKQARRARTSREFPRNVLPTAPQSRCDDVRLPAAGCFQI